MTNPDVLRRRLDTIESAVGDLRRLARPEAIGTDIRERRFVEHTLQISIQAVIDAAAHIVASERLGEPSRPYEALDLLHRHGWITATQLPVLHKIVGFRNVLVHGYDRVSEAVLQGILDQRLGDLLDFVNSIRHRLTP